MELRAEGISRSFFRKGKGTNVFTAVKETCFLLPEAKLTVLTGRSGSGKSTLLNILSGLLDPDTGRVYAGDQDLYQLEDRERSLFRNRHFGFVPQGQSAIGSLTVEENILLPFRLYREEEDTAYARELMERMGIQELSDAMPRELSGGEMRRMAIARALVRRPEVIFADEPTGDLDEENTCSVLQLLQETAEKGAAVLLVTHEPEAVKFADRICHMSGGILKMETAGGLSGEKED